MASLDSPRDCISEALLTVRKAALTVGAFSAVENMLLLVPSLFMLQVYDRVLTSRNELTLLLLVVVTISAYLLLAAIDFVRTMILIRVGTYFDMRIADSVYLADIRSRLDAKALSQQLPMADLALLRQFISGKAMWAIFDLPWFPIYLVVIFLFEPTLGWFAIAGTSTLCLLGFLNEHLTRAAAREAGDASARAGLAAGNFLRNADVIQALGMISATLRRWLSLHHGSLTLQARVSEKVAMVASLTKFFQLAMQSMVLAVASLLVIQGKITPGMMIAASLLITRALSPVQQAINHWKTWDAAAAALVRLRALISAHALVPDNVEHPLPHGALSVQNISAAIPSCGRLVLRNVTFQLAPGDALAVVGPSGGGKSTLARILTGIWPLLDGAISIDGYNCIASGRAKFGDRLGYLPQNISLIKGTIAENISRFEGVGIEEVVAAAKMARAHEMILSLPNGYQTEIGEGETLSGGQRQRVALARALYRNPSLIILDEPNSNLDDDGRNKLLDTIRELRQRAKIVILVTHGRGVLSVASHMLMLGTDGTGKFATTREMLPLLSLPPLPQRKRSGTPKGAGSIGGTHSSGEQVAGLEVGV